MYMYKSQKYQNKIYHMQKYNDALEQHTFFLISSRVIWRLQRPLQNARYSVFGDSTF